MTRPTGADFAGRRSSGRRPGGPFGGSAAGTAGGPADGSAGAAAGGPVGVAAGGSVGVSDDRPLTASWDPQPPLPRDRSRARRRPRGPVARILSTYGWRIYAVPVLVVLTVLAVFDVARPSSGESQGASGAPATADGWAGGTPGEPAEPGGAARVPLIPNPVPGAGFEEVKASAELPGGGPFTAQGAGSWRVVPGAGEPFGTGQLFTYTVEVEDGVVLEGGPEGFATTVDATLKNPKSWIGSGRYQFQRIDDSAAADLRISLTSQLTTRAVCGFRIPFDASCWRADDRRVVINNARWARGAVAFEGNVVQYQQYVINHEVGHGLGFPHTGCPADGQLAPVMMQQTWGLDNDYLAALGTDRVVADGKRCAPNAWPFPTIE